MQLAQSTLPLGSRWVNSIEMATHVEPIVENWRTGVQIPPAPPIPKGQQFAVGLFSCPIAPVPACSRGGACGSLRTSASGPWPRPGPPSSLSRPFFSPASLPHTRPKSAKAANTAITNQYVTRGRIKRLDCSFARPKETTPFTLVPTRFEECQKRLYTSDTRRRPMSHLSEAILSAAQALPEGGLVSPKEFLHLAS